MTMWFNADAAPVFVSPCSIMKSTPSAAMDAVFVKAAAVRKQSVGKRNPRIASILPNAPNAGFAINPASNRP